MKVYPVNAMEIATAFSGQLAEYNEISHLWNRYIEFQVEFSRYATDITFIWDRGISMNSFIIGNTNALRGRLQFFYRDYLFWEKNFEMDEYIKILVNKNEEGSKITALCDRVELKLEGTENTKIGYVFMGEEWELPRFTVSPSRQVQIRNGSGRTFSGQVSGIPQDTLKTFNAEFLRIEQEWFKILDDYANGVQSVIPHVIDPYYEAHDKFPPFFATLEDFGEQEKREENGFYWNFGMSWQEAR